MQPASTFYPFPRLPMELRLDIWEAAADLYDEPVTIHISIIDQKILSPVPSPALLNVNTEPRKCMKRCFLPVQSVDGKTLGFFKNKISLLEIDFAPASDHDHLHCWYGHASWIHFSTMLGGLLQMAEHLHLRRDYHEMFVDCFYLRGGPLDISHGFRGLERLKLITTSQRTVHEINNGAFFWCEIHIDEPCTCHRFPAYPPSDPPVKAYLPLPLWSPYLQDLDDIEPITGVDWDDVTLFRCCKFQGVVQLPVSDELTAQGVEDHLKRSRRWNRM